MYTYTRLKPQKFIRFIEAFYTRTNFTTLNINPLQKKNIKKIKMFKNK